jgi:hypothetical protein
MFTGLLMHYQFNQHAPARDLNAYPRGLCSFGAVLLQEPLDLTKVNEVQLRVWGAQARARRDLATLTLIDAELAGRADR